MKTKKVLSISGIFERHSSLQATAYISVGRLIKHNDQFGVFDATGILWPIFFKQENSIIKSGDMLKFECFWNQDILTISNILNIVPQNSVWKNRIISDPMNIDASIFENHNESIANTQYFIHPTLSRRYDLLSLRNKAITHTKRFFEQKKFFHVETPILVPSGGMESYLYTFQTTYHDFHGREWSLELPTSPEFALKKILAEGFPNVFQIARSFRNFGEKSDLHEPEFFMLEWYRAGALLSDILTDTKNFVLSLAKTLKCKRKIPKVWKIYTVKELFINLLSLNLDDLQETQNFYEKSKTLSVSIRDSDTWDDIFCKLFMEKIEPFLKTQVACFVTDYPVQMGALAEVHPTNPNYVQRAEAYLFGIEISNGYQELVNFEEFANRLSSTQQKRNGTIKRDRDFENAMKFGLPPCSGNALGLDRLISILLNCERIQDIIPLPLQTV